MPSLQGSEAEKDFLRSLAGELYSNPEEAIDPNTDIGRRRREILIEMGVIKKRLDDLDNLPEEPTGPGTVITFTKFFGGGTGYSYAAIRAANGWWYVTGGRENNSRKTWPSLVGFIRASETEMPVVLAATAFERVI
jgi:hypothetical protein